METEALKKRNREDSDLKRGIERVRFCGFRDRFYFSAAESGQVGL